MSIKLQENAISNGPVNILGAAASFGVVGVAVSGIGSAMRISTSNKALKILQEDSCDIKKVIKKVATDHANKKDIYEFKGINRLVFSADEGLRVTKETLIQNFKIAKEIVIQALPKSLLVSGAIGAAFGTFIALLHNLIVKEK